MTGIMIYLEPREVKTMEAALSLYRQVIRLNRMQESESFISGYSKIKNALFSVPDEDYIPKAAKKW